MDQGWVPAGCCLCPAPPGGGRGGEHDGAGAREAQAGGHPGLGLPHGEGWAVLNIGLRFIFWLYNCWNRLFYVIISVLFFMTLLSSELFYSDKIVSSSNILLIQRLLSPLSSSPPCSSN